MTIKIEMKPITCEIEIPGYGKFQVKPMGAGAEAEIRVISRELEEKDEIVKQFDELVEKEKNGEKLDRNSEEYQACLKAYSEIGKVVDTLRDKTYEKMREVFSGEKVEQLFNDFTYEQIAKIYREATKDV